MAKKLENKVELHDLNDEQRKRLGDGLTNAVVQLTYHKSVKESYKEFINSLADELGIDAGTIRAAAARMEKGDFFEKVRKQDEIETMLQITGNLPAEDDE
ncbi:hypothetical protein EJP02_260 [Escherichia phage EJP2]|nr:hypothetical protein EJP02_260 [Escherichia phage EJP2]